MDLELPISPDWLRSVEAEEKAESAARELAALQLETAMLRVQANAPTFLQELIRELAVCVKALDPETRSGSVTTWGDPEYEQGCRVLVRRNHIIPKETHTDMHFRKGGCHIRCNTVEGRAFLLSFCVCGDNKVCVQANDANAPMDHRQAVQFILKPMLALTKRP
jgi:hypothetical protein